jgi:hypothetical protein
MPQKLRPEVEFAKLTPGYTLAMEIVAVVLAFVVMIMLALDLRQL